MSIFLISALPFIITIAATQNIITFSNRNGIGLDIPGRRKVHRMPVPRTGGAAIFMGLTPLLFLVDMDKQILSYFIATLIIFLTGIVDDIRGLKWSTKMAGIMLATTVTIFYGDTYIRSLGDIFGYGEVFLGPLAIPVTYFCVLGVVNAMNLIDGLNGLAGGIAVTVLIVLATFAYVVGEYNYLFISLALAAGLAAFLKYNYPSARIFLGDSGSMLIGHSMAILSIIIFQSNGGLEPMLPVLILAIPIFDTLRVMAQRILKGKNPFHADKTHIHHILTRVGLSNKKAVITIWTLNLLFGLSALLIMRQEGWLILLLLVNSLVILTIFLRLLVDVKKLNS